jgi:hypothetical protein
MPVHDWTRVTAGEFHDFHGTWIFALRRRLNKTLLPEGFYAMSDQHAAENAPDVLTLQRDQRQGGVDNEAPEPLGWRHNSAGGVAVADVPPQLGRAIDLASSQQGYAQRRLTVRHVNGDQIIAVIEIVSPGNQDRPASRRRFREKVASLIDAGVHVTVINVFGPRPTAAAPLAVQCLHEVGIELPEHDGGGPLVQLAVDAVGHKAWLGGTRTGSELPDLPLFLDAGWYVPLPLQDSYDEAFDEFPEQLRGNLSE